MASASLIATTPSASLSAPTRRTVGDLAFRSQRHSEQASQESAHRMNSFMSGFGGPVSLRGPARRAPSCGAGLADKPPPPGLGA